MLKKLSFFVALALMIFGAQDMQAQNKYGHLNLGNLMEQMPEIAVANANLVALNDSLSLVDSTMSVNFRAKYESYMQAAEAGTMTRVQMEQQETVLRAEQETIVAFEETAQRQIQARKERLLSPILARIDVAVKAVAVENNYKMVFDTSVGMMLYVADTEDMMDLVKAKLGI